MMDQPLIFIKCHNLLSIYKLKLKWSI